MRAGSATLNPAVADYQALCVPSAGSGRHFRIEGAQTIGNNGFFYLALGFPAAPTDNPTIAAAVSSNTVCRKRTARTRERRAAPPSLAPRAGVARAPVRHARI